jgi:hypothetical protein
MGLSRSGKVNKHNGLLAEGKANKYWKLRNKNAQGVNELVCCALGVLCVLSEVSCVCVCWPR